MKAKRCTDEEIKRLESISGNVNTAMALISMAKTEIAAIVLNNKSAMYCDLTLGSVERGLECEWHRLKQDSTKLKERLAKLKRTNQKQCETSLEQEISDG